MDARRNGHVIITSRASEWADIAVPSSRRSDPRRIRSHPAGPAARVGTEDADGVADAVGDLALAVVQAAGYMADAGPRHAST